MGKKILFCNNLLSGMLQFRADIIEHFINKGWEAVVVTPPERDEEVVDEIPKGAKFITIQTNRTSTNPLNDIKYFLSLLHIFKEERPNYVINYTIKPNIYGAMAAKLLGIPCTDMMAGLGYTFTNNKLSSKIARTLYRIGLKCSQHLLLLNEENVKAVKRLKMCNPEKIIWMKGGEGVDLNRFSFFDNTSKDVSFFFIGRLIEEKGYNEFVAAARIVKQKYPDVNFLVLGGYDLNYPKHISKEQIQHDSDEGTIEYLGTTNDMLSMYRRKGIVTCIPSYYSEGLNRSLMESCAVGKPIITTDHPGCRETVVDGENGYLVPVKDVDSLAKAMIKYIELSDEDKQRMSKASRRHAEDVFGIDKVIKVYDGIVD